jgi:hypothetical protein
MIILNNVRPSKESFHFPPRYPEADNMLLCEAAPNTPPAHVGNTVSASDGSESSVVSLARVSKVPDLVTDDCG